MKKSYLCIIMIATIALGGCRNSSDQFLAYEDATEAPGHSIDNRISEADFLAEDIAVISKYDNFGEDELLNSGATLLINATDNEVFYADHVYDKMYPASLTKLLTALVVLGYGEINDSVTISFNASHIEEPGARVCGYSEGDILSMEALLNSLLVYSGNDAAIAIAEHVGGNEEAFVKMMNDEATKIGAVHSNFVNSSGLHDENQYTTAYDMYLIFNKLLEYDTFRNIISSSSYTVVYKDKAGNELEKILSSTNSYQNNNDLADLGITMEGGLTGATGKAGNCSILLSEDSNNTEFISIILKASDSDIMHSQIAHLLSMAVNN